MNARDFLDYAQKQAGQSEAADRSATSRAYYAVYHVGSTVSRRPGT